MYFAHVNLYGVMTTRVCAECVLYPFVVLSVCLLSDATVRHLYLDATDIIFSFVNAVVVEIREEYNSQGSQN